MLIMTELESTILRKYLAFEKSSVTMQSVCFEPYFSICAIASSRESTIFTDKTGAKYSSYQSVFEATLTLPGIAGIILTVGMAVDANVLIFERIKEELKSEKNNLIAFDSGYTKSRTAILDANITTLLAAIILFFMGSGPIKGFSLTLGIGIFTTLFTVYFIARLLTVLYVSKNKEKEGLI